MPLRFREDRTTQAAARLLRHAGGQLPHISLIKLLYLADRRALLSLGRPISYDRYASLDHGPVLSRTFDLISSEPRPGIESYWRDHISPPENYEVRLIKNAPGDQLSPAEEAILDEVFQEFGNWDRWKLVEYMHTLPEWRDPHGSSVPLFLKDILIHEGMDDAEVKAREEDLAAEALASQLFE